MVITISCPACATSFPVDPNKIPEAGVKVRCSQCAHVFRVERPAPEPEPEVEVEPEVETPAATVEGEDWSFGRDPFAEAAEDGHPPEGESAVEVAEPGAADEPSSAEEMPDWARSADDAEEAEPEAAAASTEASEAAPEPPEADVAAAALLEEPEAAPALPEEPEPMPALPESERDEPREALPEVEDEGAGALPEPEPTLHGTPTPSLEPEPIPEPTPYEPASVPEPSETRSVPEPEPMDATPAAQDRSGEPVPSEPAEPAPSPEAQPVQGFTFGKRDPMDKARRLARVLVSDMVMYNADRHRTALAQGTLAEDFDEEIDKSWKEYVDQVGRDLAEGEGKHFWTQALNDILAKGQSVF